MILLRFRAENHQSLRDEAVLSLVRPSLSTPLPKDGDWVGATTRVAGIYGANASGKSTVVDALQFFRATVMKSATSWSLRKKLPQQPFLLDPDAKGRLSGYAVDFVLNEIRYQYGFEIDHDAVRQEWLYDYPSTKHRMLFEREGEEFKFGRDRTVAPRDTPRRRAEVARGRVRAAPSAGSPCRQENKKLLIAAVLPVFYVFSMASKMSESVSFCQSGRSSQSAT